MALVVPGYWRALSQGVVPGFEHASAFVGRDFATVLDVGANKGQFAAFARRRWPRARLICFEPLPGPRKRLEGILGNSEDVFAVALGNYDGEAEIHIASREDSSSLLPLGDGQRKLFHMHELACVSVPVRRLDTVISKELVRPTLLKIDVQGYEFQTLQGSVGLLESIDAAYVECSFSEMYSGQVLADDVAKFLGDFGLVETGRFNLCRIGGRDVQADLLFERRVP